MSTRRGAEVTLAGVSKSFGDTVAVDDVAVRLPAESFTALLGPSGCGKSTLLQVLAGLESADRGDVRLDGTSVLRQPAELRPVSLVFQKPTLFPHLSVAQNVGFGLRMAGWRRADTRRAVTEMLSRVRLGGLGGRRPHQLSGGQEQRVALARALVVRPRLLLLDEPFSQLDATLRAEMRSLVRELHDESGVTTLFVTHDQAEAVDVADRIALMDHGRLLGEGPPESFYTSPPSPRAARFFGFVNEVRGRVADGVFVDAESALRMATTAGPGAAVLMTRPEAITLTRPEDPAPAPGPAQETSATSSGRVDARVTRVRFGGSHQEVRVRTGDTRLVVHVPVLAVVAVGDLVQVRLSADRTVVFPATGA